MPSARLWRGMGETVPRTGSTACKVFLRNTRHGLYAFHESRDTKHWPFVRRRWQGTHNQEPPPGLPPPPPGIAPARCGAAWGGYCAAWAAAVPRSATRPVGATNHATCFPPPPALQATSNSKPGLERVFTNPQTRDTNHPFFETRLFIRLDALFTIAHHCPALPGIARQKILPGKCLHTVSRSRKALRRDHAAFRAPWAAATTK